MPLLFRGHLPLQDLKPSVVMLGYGRARFNEIAGVHISDPANIPDRGVMNVAAHYSMGVMASCGLGKGSLESADEIHRILHLQFSPLRQGPVRKSKRPAYLVEPEIGPKRQCI